MPHGAVSYGEHTGDAHEQALHWPQLPQVSVPYVLHPDVSPGEHSGVPLQEQGPHVQSPPHSCVPSTSHACTLYGVQPCPVQLPHWPQLLQVWVPQLPQPCVAFGVHTGVPVHEHAPHAQLAVQVCVPSMSHDCVALGAQTP